jgi:3-oxoacyl-[acyl-carrier protein] reductase
MRGLKGKRAVITGAGQGIGRAIAQRFAEEGCRLLLTDIRPEPLETTAGGLRAAGAEVHTIVGDVASSDDAQRVAEKAAEVWEGVDILANNAGISNPAHFFDLSLAQWQRMLDVNLTGVFLLSQHIGRWIERAGGGAIVNMSSTNGLVAEAELAHYNASKGGVTLLTKSMAIDLAPRNIRVNAVCPGFIRTPMTEAFAAAVGDQGFFADYVNACVPLKRPGLPHEVAACFAFLASDDASFITGETLVVDGGQLAF